MNLFADGPRAETAAGTVRGTLDGPIAVFKGIPFAAPPVAPLRWRPPQPVAPWPGVRDAHCFGPSCPQAFATPTQLAPLERLDEDCLYLNVWAPAEQSTTPMPVMVWIHGGAFISGTGSEAEFDGRRLAERGVIVITFNYRIGRLGFFAHPALAAANPDDPRGNYGFLDQIAALQWVRDNIAAFGGAPDNVTLFGESAGGVSVMALSTAPLVTGLYHKAIIQSGAIDGLFRDLTSDTPSHRSAEAIAREWAEAQGIAGADESAAERLRALPIETVAPSAPGYQDILALMQGGGPIVDGTVIPLDPFIAYTAGKQNPVPMILGTTGFESIIWIFLGDTLATLPVLPMDLATLLPAMTAEAREAMLARYQAIATPDTALGLLAADAVINLGAFRFAALAATHAPTFHYRFDAVLTPGRAIAPGSPHGTDIFYVFGTLDRFLHRPDFVTDDDRRVASLMMDYWTSFARTGVPSAVGAPEWPTCEPAAGKLLLISDEGAMVTGMPRRELLEAMEQAT